MKESTWKKRADDRVDYYTQFVYQSTEVPGGKPDVLQFLHKIKDVPASMIVPILQKNDLFEDFLRVMQRIARKIRWSFNDPMFSHEDLVQEVLFRITRSDTMITTTGSGFVITTLRNLIYDTIRKKTNKIQHDDYFELATTSYGNFELAIEHDLIETIHEKVKAIFAGAESTVTYLNVLEMFIAFFGQEEVTIETGEANGEERLQKFAQRYFAENYSLYLSEGATKARIYRFRQFMGERFPYFRADHGGKRSKKEVNANISQVSENEPPIDEQAQMDSDSTIIKKFLEK